MRAAFYKATRPALQGLYSRAVRFIERGPYSHCELAFGDGMALERQRSRDFNATVGASAVEARREAVRERNRSG